MIIEYQNEEIKICLSCNICFKSSSSLVNVKYSYCPYCQGTLWLISELIEKEND